MKLNFLLPLFLLFSDPINAQEFKLNSITTENGLSHGYITSIFQDSKGFIWIGTFYGLNRYDGYEIKSYLPNFLDQWSLHATKITSFAEDKNGYLWIGTDFGVAVMQPQSEKFILLSDITKEAPKSIVKDVLIDENQKVWFLGANEIYTLENIAEIHSFFQGSKAAEIKINSIPVHSPIRLFQRTGPNEIAVRTTSDFFILNLTTNGLKKADLPQQTILKGFHSSTVMFPNHDLNDQMPIQERFAILEDLQKNKSYFFQFFDQNIYEISKEKSIRENKDLKNLDVVASIDQPQSFARMVDKNGKIWVGTIGSGIRILEPISKAFSLDFQNIGFFNPAIMPDHQLWGGMYANDIFANLKTKKVSKPIWINSLKSNESVHSAFYDEKNHAIFLIVQSGEAPHIMARFDLSSQKIEYLNRLKTKTANPVIFYQDKKEDIWLSSATGEILRYQQSTKSVDHWNLNEKGATTRSIEQDINGRLWLGGDDGLTMIDLSEKSPKFEYFNNQGEKGPIFRNSLIFDVHPDPQNPNLLWLATLSGGLAKFDISTQKIEYLENQFDIVTGIIPDHSGNMWLTTNKGTFLFQPETKIFFDFTKQMHFPRPNISAAANLKGPDGKIIMGSNTGILLIDPDKINVSNSAGELVLSDIKINGEGLTDNFLTEKIILENNNTYALKLNHQDKNIEIKFSIPIAERPESIQYRFKLTGRDQDWIYLGTKSKFEFSELAPGGYILEVQAIGPLENWDNSKKLILTIFVKSPWYNSTLAWMIYILGIIGIIYLMYLYDRKRLNLQFEAELNQQKMKELQTLDQFKNRFFAYIAHEFKTPLTIIRGAAAKIKSNDYSEVIVREGNNMNYLINELVDVTRLQDKTIEPHYENRDLNEFLKIISSSYQPLLDLHQITLKLGFATPELTIDFDPLRTQYIINNILSNAIRFTPKGGVIEVSTEGTDQDKAIIKVSDNGKGIPKENLPHIFDQYYSGDEEPNNLYNFGLGLPFVKELAEILHGEIKVESTPGKGTAFTLSIPQKAPVTAVFKQSPVDIISQNEHGIFNASSKAGNNAPTLLVVEDNPAVQSYLKSVLEPIYQVNVAVNGKEGFEFALQEIPDLILTDVMMPVMDGIEMTDQLKKNPLTSHIPIIILSAKSEIQDKITGQKAGADGYLAKPFDEQELILSLHNLYQLQSRWKERYHAVANGEKLEEAGNYFSPESIVHHDEFIRQIMDAFEANYASESFDAIELANILNISKSQLYRKVANISEDGIMGMLRNFRLQKAMEMLRKNPNWTTKEIAFKVGFKEYSHFSASFKKQFHLSPTEWRKAHV
jgi:signal transduction histidine kinase/ligand-binding sensor domain-containing protein/DNA-binding NarL/FixJ family response regulator